MKKILILVFFLVFVLSCFSFAKGAKHLWDFMFLCKSGKFHSYQVSTTPNYGEAIKTAKTKAVFKGCTVAKEAKCHLTITGNTGAQMKYNCEGGNLKRYQ